MEKSYFKTIFNTEKDKGVELKKRSENAVGFLKNTITSLETINEELDIEQEKKLKQISELKEQSEGMELDKQSNSKIINKMKDFFGIINLLGDD